MERNEKTRALLAAFGCALAYLLAGKALAAVLPQVPEEAARMWAFVHRCAAAPIVEELVFRGAIQQLARPLGERQAVALQAVLFAVQHRRHRPPWPTRWCAAWGWGALRQTAPDISGRGCCCIQCKQSAGAGERDRGWGL